MRFEFIPDILLPAFEHPKLWCLQTLCWLSGEQWLPIGLLVYCILGNVEVIKYHIFISVVVIELSVQIEVLNTKPEDRLSTE